MKRRRTSRESGMVLIAVVWGVFVLTVMAFALAALVRTGGEELRARKEHLQAYYMARGGVYKAIAIVTAPQVNAENATFRPGQRELSWREPQGEVRVEVQDESGKLDVNATPEAVLERLFMNLGLDYPSAHALVAVVEDWRDADSDTRLGGAEEGYYAMLPQPYRPANTDFTSVEELLLVRGVTPELFWGQYEVQRDGSVRRRLGLVDCLTVLTRGAGVNINYAPVPVLLALPHMTAEVVAYILDGRQKQPFGSVSDFTRAYPVLLDGETLATLNTGSSGRYTLVTAGVMPSGVTARVRALVQVQGLTGAQASLPFLILGWNDSYVQ